MNDRSVTNGDMVPYVRPLDRDVSTNMAASAENTVRYYTPVSYTGTAPNDRLPVNDARTCQYDTVFLVYAALLHTVSLAPQQIAVWAERVRPSTYDVFAYRIVCLQIPYTRSVVIRDDMCMYRLAVEFVVL